MTTFQKIMNALSSEMVEPTMFGWFHLLFIGLIVLSTVLLCWRCKNWEWNKTKKWLLVFWIVMVLFEAYKQLVYPWNTATLTWRYPWYIFPFQLCSTPLYVLPVLIFSKNEKVKDACAAFLMTFSLFGGLVTILYPPQVFVSTIGVNIQTMVHHGLQIVIGVFLACYYRKKLNLKFYFKGVIVFLITFIIALALNFIVPQFINESFNMFYISIYEPCTLPLLGDFIYPNVPWAVFLLIYLVGFTIIGLIFYYIEFGFSKINIKKAKK